MADDGKKIIEAQEFRIVDEHGNKRAVIGIGEAGVIRMTVYDKNGQRRASIGANDESGFIAIYDAKGNPRWTATSRDMDNPRMTFFDEAGNNILKKATDKT